MSWFRKYFYKRKENLPEFEISEDKSLNLIFSGKVQGVGFRYSLWDISLELGLKGWVKNLEDGRVEAFLQGPINKIEYAIDYLKNDLIIRIDKIERKDMGKDQALEGFEIR